ncbi:MAG: DUF6358 family protein [Mucilaginibacter sp.]
MYKKALRNLLYNVGIFASVMGGIYAFDRRSIILALLCIGALVFFVMEKYKIMKEIKNLPPPPRKSK